MVEGLAVDAKSSEVLAQPVYISGINLPLKVRKMSEPVTMMDFIRAEPEGTFKLYRATEEEPEVERAMTNGQELADRMRHARRSNCLIEVISLRIQYMDLWLRVFFENTPHGNLGRRREFGQLLRQCFELGLSKTIYDRISAFNKSRVSAIHGYLLGRLAYAELDAVLLASDGLSEILAEFVLLNSGEIARHDFENQLSKRGDTVRDVAASVRHLRTREPM